ncbi:MAG TPA: ABC transporter permease [Candidatus Acidoferrum sp.]|jgi:putative ABC transport system permease protein|nr:ABC transporter permease [Candidatus Acidoferrum sp.]
MALLARRNLFHDRIRFAVTLTGIVFALVLIIIQFGLFLGFTTTTSNNIDHSGADIWIVFHGVGYFDTGRMFSERKFYEVLSVPGVRQAEKYIQNFAYWKKPDGGVENVQVIGFHPGSGLGEPWNVVEGSVLDVKLEDGVIVDELYKEKLGVSKIGDRVEIGDHRARVVGFTRGIRSFTTSPFVYTSFKNALNYTRPEAREDQLAYILVTVAPGVPSREVLESLRARLTDVDIYTREEFSRRTRFYWMFTTGAGLAVLTAALMGLVVGVAVVAQTIYAATMDHIREYGTLKAMGASNGYLYRVLIEQAAWSAVLGYAFAMFAAHFIVQASEKGGALILLPPAMKIAMLVLAVFMCIAAALVSINKVTRLDPAMVFRG